MYLVSTTPEGYSTATSAKNRCDGTHPTNAVEMAASVSPVRRVFSSVPSATTSKVDGRGLTRAWYRKSRSSRPLCTTSGPLAFRRVACNACRASDWSPVSVSSAGMALDD